jgi:hypothetical protein
MLPAIKPTGTCFGDAIEAFGIAARAIRMHHGGHHPGGCGAPTQLGRSGAIVICVTAQTGVPSVP